MRSRPDGGGADRRSANGHGQRGRTARGIRGGQHDHVVMRRVVQRLDDRERLAVVGAGFVGDERVEVERGGAAEAEQPPAFHADRDPATLQRLGDAVGVRIPQPHEAQATGVHGTRGQFAVDRFNLGGQDGLLAGGNQPTPASPR